MLSETMTTLAELLDDPDHQVEKECRELIKEIEKLSGENLNQYLQ